MKTPTTTAAPSGIAVGVAGWSYPDWNGVVYPPGTKDQLAYIARYVDLMEINSSFYRPPARKTTEGWVRRTPSTLHFTAKLHQDITHRGRLDPAMRAAMGEAFTPLIEAGRLECLLAQFRYDFDCTHASTAYLSDLVRHYRDLAPLTLELRHNTWQSPRALEFLEGLGVTVANLDYPTARDSFNLRHCRVGTRQAYLRLHGRNRKAWFSKAAGRDDTYNYLYSREEIEDIAERAAALATEGKQLLVVANNHYRGKEVVNALEIKARVTGREVDAPPLLVQHYPRLKDIAR